MNMKGRFLYVGGFQLPDKNAAAQRVLGIAKLLRMLDYDVIFLDNSDSWDSDDLSAMHKVEGFNVFTQRHPHNRKQWANYVMKPLHVTEILDSYENWLGIIAYNYPAVALAHLKIQCHQRNLKLIADCTEWYHAKRKLSIRNLSIVLDSFLRMRIVHKHVDGVIAISSYLTNYYRKHVKTIFLPPMVDLSMAKWRIAPQTLPKYRCNLVYAGSPGKSKDDLERIYEIVIANKGTELYALGIEYTDYPILEADKSRVHLLGWKSHPECLSYLLGADYMLLLQPKNRTTMAGFPTKFVEGVSCGIPVICCDVGDPANYVKKYGNAIIVQDEAKGTEIPERSTVKYQKIKDSAGCIRNMFDFKNYQIEIREFLDYLFM